MPLCLGVIPWTQSWHRCAWAQGVSTDPDKAGPRIVDVGGRKMLQLLNDCSGAFRPGVLTALVGSSGAGKTTLMDVLAGRKTSARLSWLLMQRCLSWLTFPSWYWRNSDILARPFMWRSWWGAPARMPRWVISPSRNTKRWIWWWQSRVLA